MAYKENERFALISQLERETRNKIGQVTKAIHTLQSWPYFRQKLIERKVKNLKCAQYEAHRSVPEHTTKDVISKSSKSYDDEIQKIQDYYGKSDFSNDKMFEIFASEYQTPFVFVTDWFEDNNNIIGIGCDFNEQTCALQLRIPPGLFVLTRNLPVLRAICTILGYTQLEVYDNLTYVGNNFALYEVLNNQNGITQSKSFLVKIVTNSYFDVTNLFRRFKTDYKIYNVAAVTMTYDVSTQVLFELVVRHRSKCINLQKLGIYVDKQGYELDEFEIPQITYMWFDEYLNYLEPDHKFTPPAPLLEEITFDIETVSTDPNRVPTGEDVDDVLFTTAIHHVNKNIIYILVYIPIDRDPSDLKKEMLSLDEYPYFIYENRIQSKVIKVFNNEKKLLIETLKYLRPDSDKHHYLIGYNSINYDMKYLLIRSYMYRLAERELFVYKSHYSLGFSQIKIDLFRIAMMRYPKFSKYTLKYVANVLLNSSKVDVDAVRLRYTFHRMMDTQKLYPNDDPVSKKKNIPSLYQSLYYNVIDTILVTELITQTKAIDYFINYAKRCRVALHKLTNYYNVVQFKLINECFAVGLSKGIFLNTFKHYESYVTFPFLRQWINPQTNCIELMKDYTIEKINFNQVFMDRDVENIPARNTRQIECSVINESYQPQQQQRSQANAEQPAFKYIGGANFCYGEYSVNHIQCYDYRIAYPLLIERKNISDETCQIFKASHLLRLYPFISRPDEFESWDYINHVSSNKTRSKILHHQFIYNGSYCGGQFPFTYKELERRQDSPVILIWTARKGVLSSIIAEFNVRRETIKQQRDVLKSLIKTLDDYILDIQEEEVELEQLNSTLDLNDNSDDFCNNMVEMSNDESNKKYPENEMDCNFLNSDQSDTSDEENNDNDNNDGVNKNINNTNYVEESYSRDDGIGICNNNDGSGGGGGGGGGGSCTNEQNSNDGNIDNHERREVVCAEVLKIANSPPMEGLHSDSGSDEDSDTDHDEQIADEDDAINYDCSKKMSYTSLGDTNEIYTTDLPKIKKRKIISDTPLISSDSESENELTNYRSRATTSSNRIPERRIMESQSQTKNANTIIGLKKKHKMSDIETKYCKFNSDGLSFSFDKTFLRANYKKISEITEELNRFLASINIKLNEVSSEYLFLKTLISSIYGVIGKHSKYLGGVIAYFIRIPIFRSSYFMTSKYNCTLYYCDTDSMLVYNPNANDLSGKLNSMFNWTEIEMKNLGHCDFVSTKVYYYRDPESGKLKYGSNNKGPLAWREAVDFFDNYSNISTLSDMSKAFYEFFKNNYIRMFASDELSDFQFLTHDIKVKSSYVTFTPAAELQLYLAKNHPELASNFRQNIFFFMTRSNLTKTILRPSIELLNDEIFSSDVENGFLSDNSSELEMYLDDKSSKDLSKAFDESKILKDRKRQLKISRAKKINLLKFYYPIFKTCFNIIKFHIKKNNVDNNGRALNIDIDESVARLEFIDAFRNCYYEWFEEKLTIASLLEYQEYRLLDIFNSSFEIKPLTTCGTTMNDDLKRTSKVNNQNTIDQNKIIVEKQYDMMNELDTETKKLLNNFNVTFETNRERINTIHAD